MTLYEAIMDDLLGMSDEDIKRDREIVRQAVQHKLHPWRAGVEIFFSTYEKCDDEQLKKLMRELAPYMFEDGHPVRPRPS